LLIYRGTHTVADKQRDTHISLYREENTQLVIYRRGHTFDDIQRDTYI